MNPDRMQAFSDEVGEMKLQGTKADRERWLFVLGVVALVGGVVVAVVGGIQASGTTNTADQVAAIATGSFVGIALVVLGAALFVRYALGRFLRFWLVRLVHEQRSETDRLIAAIQQLDRRDP